jgi:hypothetical protein
LMPKIFLAIFADPDTLRLHHRLRARLDRHRCPTRCASCSACCCSCRPPS